MTTPLQTDDPPRVEARVVAVALAGFWGCFVALNTVRSAFFGGGHQGEALVRRVLIALVGMARAERALTAQVRAFTELSTLPAEREQL